MKLVTRQQLANRAAATWKRIYGKYDKWPTARASTVYNNLLALGPTPNPDAVREIMGKGFVDLHCTLCDQDVEGVVLYDKISICQSCAEQMVGLFADGEGED